VLLTMLVRGVPVPEAAELVRDMTAEEGALDTDGLGEGLARALGVVGAASLVFVGVTRAKEVRGRSLGFGGTEAGGGISSTSCSGTSTVVSCMTVTCDCSGRINTYLAIRGQTNRSHKDAAVLLRLKVLHILDRAIVLAQCLVQHDADPFARSEFSRANKGDAPVAGLGYRYAPPEPQGTHEGMWPTLGRSSGKTPQLSWKSLRNLRGCRLELPLVCRWPTR
jgi:hypothetical protein